MDKFRTPADFKDLVLKTAHLLAQQRLDEWAKIAPRLTARVHRHKIVFEVGAAQVTIDCDAQVMTPPTALAVAVLKDIDLHWRHAIRSRPAA
ncbi:hypothetical protein CcrBL47_gp374 [Caulobacter phage BL47]|nr:hypothetical protein CcrBL47_gp374 [Caulobacter phage BL47]